MKILMIAPEPFFEPRGTPISVYQRLEALSALGHQVDLLTYHLGTDIDFPNVRILRVPKVGFIKNVRIGPSRAKILLDGLLILKAFWRLLWHHYEVIHSHEEAAFFSAPLAWIFRKRHLYDMHSVLSRQLNNFKFGNHPIFVKIFEFLERWVLRTCDAVITIAPDLEDYVHQVNPHVQEIKIDNIGLQAFQKPVEPKAVQAVKQQVGLNGKVLVVYTGTFEQYQGLEMVLESAKIIQEKIPSLLFLFVGGKRNQVANWTRKTREMGVSDCTMFLNAVPPDEAMAYLVCAHVLISPRKSGSTIPLKIYSYLHAGRPIVATRISAHTQVLNSDIACLVEPTKEAIAEGILHILRHPEVAESLGAQAHDYAQEHFGYEKYRAKVNQIYKYLEGYPVAELVTQDTKN